MGPFVAWLLELRDEHGTFSAVADVIGMERSGLLPVRERRRKRRPGQDEGSLEATVARYAAADRTLCR